MDPNSPETWTDATTPFQVLRFYAEDDIKDPQLQAILDAYAINSLDSLITHLFDFASVLKREAGPVFVKDIKAAMIRTKEKPTEVLGGKLEFDRTCISEKVLKLFTPSSVSVTENGPVLGVVHEGQTPPSNARYPNFTLVMGSSGSGKTMFCLKELPRIVFPDAASNKEIFRVHVAVDKLLKKDPSEVDLPTLQTLLVDYVHAVVEKRVSDYVTTTVPPINLFLHVVLDEAGGTEYNCYFDEAGKIDSLVNALENMKEGKFTKGVHLTLTGTALETVTQSINSSVETIKFRMQPWENDHFVALLAKLERKDEEKVKKMVTLFPILSSLITNARCAYFLATTLPDLTPLSEEQLVDYVEAAVASVVRCYVQSNVLNYLGDMNDKFTAVQEVFKAVNNAMIDPTKVCIPTFDVGGRTVRKATQSMLDVNVEIKDRKVALIPNATYSVSITSALTIVLTEFLCQKARICWNWQAFEATAALGEWKRMITEMEAQHFSSSCGITYLRSPVPHDHAEVRFTVPLVGRSTIVLNGRNAKYELSTVSKTQAM